MFSCELLLLDDAKGKEPVTCRVLTLCYPLFQGLKKVKAQGFGANTDEEMDQYGKNDMRALSEMLGNKVP
jgi:hypothetical protein